LDRVFAAARGPRYEDCEQRADREAAALWMQSRAETSFAPASAEAAS